MSAYIRTGVYLALLTVGLCCPVAVRAIAKKNPILIICSYNPGAYPTSVNISDFMDKYNSLGGSHDVVIENMNCKTFSDAPHWKKLMLEILDKYKEGQKPELVVLFGQEAWSAYLSQDESVTGNIPVLTALGSRNMIRLPEEDEDLKGWMPESLDFFADHLDKDVQGGYLYEYDIAENIKMAKALYPDTKNIAFLSDNTYGGVTLQALVRSEMKSFPELNLILLDGRRNTIYTIVDEFRALPKHTVVLIGTWRVDMNDGYFMRNATYTMMEANPDVPVLTSSSLGLGYWAVGGVIPDYRSFGDELAHEALQIADGHKPKRGTASVVACKAVIDYKKAEKLHINLETLPMEVEVVNEPPTFYEQYKYQIWAFAALFIALTGGLFVALYNFVRTKRLKDKLERSEVDLREAKERAEESNRLKNAFLANVSHEIRTPLNAIVGFSDVLVMGGGSQEEQQHFSDIIRTNSDLLLHLIDDILDISKLETDKMTLTFEECDIVQVAEYALTSVQLSKSGSRNQFVFKTDLEHLILRTDVHRMQQVIINLLSNANKFTSGGTITLDVAMDREQNRVLISVTDTGCGIPKEKQKQVFERFEKLNEYVQGTGLGLSICRLIVNKWGGDIWVDPSYEGGARLVFTAPCK